VKMKKRMAMRKRNQKVRGVNGVTCIYICDLGLWLWC
jgi:hypothetical protein